MTLWSAYVKGEIHWAVHVSGSSVVSSHASHEKTLAEAPRLMLIALANIC